MPLPRVGAAPLAAASSGLYCSMSPVPSGRLQLKKEFSRKSLPVPTCSSPRLCSS